MRLIRRADGYYAQFSIKIDRIEVRDTNASIIILNRGLDTLGRRRFKAQGDKASMLSNASSVG